MVDAQLLEVPGHLVELRTVSAVSSVPVAADNVATIKKSGVRAAWRGLRDHSRSWDRIKLLVAFAVFCIGLPAADVITDALGGAALFHAGHPHWACATWALMLAPTSAALAIMCFTAITRRSCADCGWTNVRDALRHIPIIQPLA